VVSGTLIHSARGYDFIIWLFTLGRERRLREAMLESAALSPGAAVLDIGCGTGTLAIAAKRRVGAQGVVTGIDASEPMLVRARRKARKARQDVTFELASADALPFADGSFDVLLCSVMLHHLPRRMRPQMMQEARRVLSPNGRLIAIEFGAGVPNQNSLISNMHRAAHIQPDALAQLVTDAGMRVVRQSALGMLDLHAVIAQP